VDQVLSMRSWLLKSGDYFSRRIAAMVALAAIAAWVALPSQAQDSKILNIYSWSNYIGKNTISDFEKETGIKVRYDVYESNEVLHTKLLSGKSGYDIVLPSSHWAKAQLGAGFYRKLNKEKIPNIANIDPSMRHLFSYFDTGNQYFINWLWGYTTIAINIDKVQAALKSEPLPDNVWELLFNPFYTEKLKSCGISYLDSASEVIPAALLSSGLNPYSQKVQDYVDVEALLKKVRGSALMFSSIDYINYLAEGSLCVAIGWSGDLNSARQQALDKKNGVNIKVLLPKIGGLLFFDMMAIPADAANVDNAHAFMNYILRADVHANLTNTLYYANANLASKKNILPEISKNPTIYLASHELLKMQIPKPVNNDVRRKINQVFSNFKAGL
jgi:putrescine transport system substrate-binding protein